ncbi:hypothetical protein [Bacillus sinesaloumensis]|uniref:hypothetical protein n=1 Tax=Litchfieldia sinesaloumensis TaxID=1926280 RepID=UPI0009887FF5|nr:hypothetical protein [Bacillus sinesaloumensis]
MNSSSASTEEKAVKYLEEKYDTEFEVMHVEEGSKLFEDLYGGDVVTVHPKGEPDVIFTIKGSEEPYTETYLQAKWSQELQEKLKADIEKELPTDTPYKVIISNSRMSDSTNKNKTVDEVLNESNTVVVSIMTAIQTDGEPEVSQYSQGIYNLYNMLKNLGVNKYVVSVGFVDQSEDVSDFIRTSYVNNITWENLKANVYGVIAIDDRKNPDNPSDLVNPNLIIRDVNSVVENYTPIEE